MEPRDIGDLYERLAPSVYRRCLRLLGDPERARDATQEVFVRTIQKAGWLSEDRAYLPWLYRVATNYCLDQLRRGRRDDALFVDTVQTRPAGSSPAPYPRIHAERSLAAKQSISALLGQVDQRGQEIAIYAFVDGMTHEEISEVMGLSRKTVGKRLKELGARAQDLKEEMAL